MHVTTNTIPQCIATLQKAQLQVERADMPIPDNYLMMVVTKVMLSSDSFPIANEDLEDIEKVNKAWAKWCELYTKADMKETIRIQAGGRRRNNSTGLRSAVLAGGRNLPWDTPPLPHWSIWKFVSTVWMELR